MIFSAGAATGPRCGDKRRQDGGIDRKRIKEGVRPWSMNASILTGTARGQMVELEEEGEELR